MNEHDVLLQGYAKFQQARIGFGDIDPRRVIGAALRHGLSACDASCLVLAEQRGIELVTMDAKVGPGRRDWPELTLASTSDTVTLPDCCTAGNPMLTASRADGCRAVCKSNSVLESTN